MMTLSEDADFAAFQEKAGKLAVLAADLCDADTGEMVVLLAAASAWVTMLPFNKAETVAASEGRIVARTAEQDALIDEATNMFVSCYREAMEMARTTAMVLLRKDAMPPAGSTLN
jgi:hypothetical protein